MALSDGSACPLSKGKQTLFSRSICLSSNDQWHQSNLTMDILETALGFYWQGYNQHTRQTHMPDTNPNGQSEKNGVERCETQDLTCFATTCHPNVRQHLEEMKTWYCRSLRTRTWLDTFTTQPHDHTLLSTTFTQLEAAHWPQRARHRWIYSICPLNKYTLHRTLDKWILLRQKTIQSAKSLWTIVHCQCCIAHNPMTQLSNNDI